MANDSSMSACIALRKWLVFGERVGKRRDWFFEQMEDRSLDCPSHWLGKGLDLLPGVAGESNLAITH